MKYSALVTPLFAISALSTAMSAVSGFEMGAPWGAYIAAAQTGVAPAPQKLVELSPTDLFALQLSEFLPYAGKNGFSNYIYAGYVKNGSNWLKATCSKHIVGSRSINVPGIFFDGCSVAESQAPSAPDAFVLSSLALFEIAALAQPAPSTPDLVSNVSPSNVLLTLSSEKTYAKKLNKILTGHLSLAGESGNVGYVQNGESWLEIVCKSKTQFGVGRANNGTVVKFLGCVVLAQDNAPADASTVVLPLDLLKIAEGISK